MALNLNNFSGDEKQDILHTSGYAKAANGNAIGAAGTQPFSRRLELHGSAHSRTVGQYRHSAIGARRGVLGAKSATPLQSPLRIAETQSDSGQAGKSSRQGFNANSSRNTFREPPTRGYNPYA